MKIKNKKRTMIIMAVFLVVIAVLAVIFVIKSINRYIDTHSWATVRVSGVIERDTSDAFIQDYECLQGDHISFGDVSLEITDVAHDGTVQFKVIRGELKEDGTQISNGTLFLNNKLNYKIDNGSIELEVIRTRYQ